MISSVAVGVFSGIFAIGVMEGVMKQRVDEALNGEVSHLQLTDPDFRSNNDLLCYISDNDSLVDAIESLDGVEAVTSRLIVTGMASSAAFAKAIRSACV